MSPVIPVVLTADNRYIRQCATTILSALENSSSPANISFYLISPDISEDNIYKLKRLCECFNARLSVINIDLDLFSSFPTIYEHLNLNVYSRLYIPNLLPQHDRVIYLDCDIIILGDLYELFSVLNEGKVVSAIPHVQFPYQEDFKKEFSIEQEDSYFNAGVMLLELEGWRIKNYSNQLLRWIANNSTKLQFNDQDALNFMFWGNYYHLPGEWNVEARLYKEKLLGLPQTDEIAKRMKSPKIIHYTGPDKPWSSKNYVPKREVYLEYSDRLSRLIGWQIDSEVRCCQPSNFIYFLWSCFYFRMSWNLRNLLKA